MFMRENKIVLVGVLSNVQKIKIEIEIKLER